MTIDSIDTANQWRRDPNGPEVEMASFPGSAVVQLASDDALSADALVETLHPADVVITDRQIIARHGEIAWSWLISDLQTVIHGAKQPWTILVVPDIPDFGIAPPADRADEFRKVLASFPRVEARDALEQLARAARGLGWSAHPLRTQIILRENLPDETRPDLAEPV